MNSDFGTVGKYGTVSLLKQNEDTVVTAFGVDDQEVSFGKDTNCSVRLYYPDISPVHCKIVFQQHKAFLVVLGASGLLIDGCQVFPSFQTTSPATVPLANNSEIEIHNKRFRFTYPPKEVRALLMASPSKPDRRAPRLSMIQSAQVFSPRPSSNPKENLRVLQSPLKVQHSPSPTDEIVLVQGSNPHVVEEGRDLIILEDVDQPPTPSRPPSTPKKPRPSLHKLVLVRSAQRAVIKAETEKEEEAEELEVAGAVVAIDDEESSSEEDENTDSDSSGWRRSIERMWPFGKSIESTDVKEEEPESAALPQPATSEEPPATPPRPTIGFNLPFLTPQVRPLMDPKAGRLSVGGGGPQRIFLQQPAWKVTDIELPAPKESPIRGLGRGRDSLSDAERKAIQERRRSAARMPNSVFPGGAPGLSPTKPRLTASPQKLPGVAEQDNDSDTRDLLERMKQMVETKRSRNSPVPTPSDETGHTPTPVNVKEKVQETPSLADDEASPDPGGRGDQDSGDEELPPKQKGRLLRSKAAKEVAQAQEIDIPIKKTTSRKRTKAVDQDMRTDSDTTPADTSKLKRGQKIVDGSPAVNDTAIKPARRGRTPRSDPAAAPKGRRGKSQCADTEETEDNPPEPAPKTRQTKVKEEIDEVVPPKPVRRTRRTKEVENDAINKENTNGTSEEEIVVVRATRARRVAGKVKEEVVTEPELRPKRATRARTRTHE